jgi:hypothetical protein
MRGKTVAVIHSVLLLLGLALMLSSFGWLLFLSALFWVATLILHVVAIHRVFKAYPAGSRMLWWSSGVFLIFVLARYDGSDAGGFTGLSCLLWRVGVLHTSFVEGWGILQGAYLLLPLMVLIDWRVIRATNKS